MPNTTNIIRADITLYTLLLLPDNFNLFFTAGMFIIIHTSRQNTRRNTAYGIIFDVIFPLYTGLPSILYTYSSMPANATRYAMPMLNIFLIKLFSLFIIINSLLLILYY